MKNIKFGEDLDSAFIGSWIAGNFDIDDAMTSCEFIILCYVFSGIEPVLNINLFFLAIGLITQNFRDGKPMDISNTELDEVRYQRRGYGKYFAIARLLGWNVLSGLNLQENLDQEGKLDLICSH